MDQNDPVERSAIVAYTLLQELHRVLADPGRPDTVMLGIVLGTAMLCDDKIGPFRTQRIMQQAPEIVLKSDAHVTADQASRLASVLHAFGVHLQTLGAQPVAEATTAV